MRCDAARELLDLYLDEELSEETARQVERHLLRCRECAFEATGLEQTRRLLREATSHEEISPGFRERTLARLLTAFQDHLRPTPASDAARQWTLPFDRTPRAKEG